MRHHCRSVRRALLAAGLLGALAAHAAPRAQPRYGVFVYSNLCVQADSGDLGGERISLHRFAEGDALVYESTAGALGWPVVASEVNIDPGMRALYFTLQAPEEAPRTVSGKFSRDGQSLTLDGGYCSDASIPRLLPKVTDFGRPLKTCAPCPPA